MSNILQSWWRRFRNLDEVSKLKGELAVLRKEQTFLKDELYRAQMEVNDLCRRLEYERSTHHKTKGHVQKLWSFIALRHRIDVPATPGSIREILQNAEKP